MPITGREVGISAITVKPVDAVHVAVGVIRNPRGEVLIARRLAGTHLAGLWEFPGGKLEPEEAPRDGLIRELHEELGIAVTTAIPLLQILHDYPERRVLLDVWEVTAFSGQPVGRQGQPLQWVTAEALSGIAFPAANRPIAMAAQLPERYAVLESERPDPERLLANLRRLAENGLRLIQCRARGLQAQPGFAALARNVVDFCRDRDIRVLINADPAFAYELGADGVHLTAQRLMELRERPGPSEFWVAASCHDATELQQAARIGVDFAVLGPVAATTTHPDMNPLGWDRFAELVAAVNFPVYALGGLAEVDLVCARHSGARGIAAVRAFLR